MSAEICVLLPCYNASATIEASVNSLLSQTYAKFKCYVIDNCSTDNTYDLIAAAVSGDERFSIFRNARNNGASDSFGRLLNFADTRYAIFLAADDYLHPDCLQRLYGTLLENPRAICAAPLTMRFRDGQDLFLSDGTYSIQAASLQARISCYLSRVTDNSRIYGLFYTETLRRSFIDFNFYAADLVFTALTLREGSHVEVLGPGQSPLLWREVPQNMKKYFNPNATPLQVVCLVLFPFLGGIKCLKSKLGLRLFLQISPCLLKVNFILSWFVVRSKLSEISCLNIAYRKILSLLRNFV